MADPMQKAREALGRAPRPHPTNFDLVAYMDWYFKDRGLLLDELALLSQSSGAESGGKWKCAALKQGTAGGNEPADCNWPFCGCDPEADRVVNSLQEGGWTISRELSLTPTESASPSRQSSRETADTLAHQISTFAMSKFCDTVIAYLNDQASTSMESVGDAIYAFTQDAIAAAIDAGAGAGHVAERFIDQSDADRLALAWIDGHAARLDGPHREVRILHFDRGDGSVWLLWHNGRLAASATIVRDDANYSVLTRFAAPPVSASKPEGA